MEVLIRHPGIHAQGLLLRILPYVPAVMRSLTVPAVRRYIVPISGWP